MIPKKRLSRYCSEDISLIENYEQALNDTTQTWHCHHRLETDLNLSIKELKEKNLYYNRPANELILLTPSEHSKLHATINKYGRKKGCEPWNKGMHGLYSEEYINKLRDARIGKPAIIAGTKALYKDGIKKMIKPEDIQKYMEDGWKTWHEYIQFR